MLDAQNVCSRRFAIGSHRYDEIRKVAIAKAIYERGSLQKAALELKVTPSAISQSLAALEKRLGGPLFIREQGRLQPTKKCLDLLERAQPAFSALDSLFGSADHEEMRIDVLDLGTYESLAHSVLIEFARHLRADFPKVRFNVFVGRSADILKRLRTGEICTALVIETDTMDRLRKEEVGRDQLGLFIASRFADRRDDWSFVESLGFATIATGPDGLPLYQRKFVKQLSGVKAAMLSDSYEVLRRAAVSGLAATVLPHRVARRHPGELVEVTSFAGVPKSETGEHRILLVSMDRCDEAEAVYLAQLARDCFNHELRQLRSTT